jgi:CheY-like chemotaxis protein
MIVNDVKYSFNEKFNGLHRYSNLKKILIVDDQSFNVDAAIAILKYAIKLKDFQEICDFAYQGKEALDMVIKNVESNQKIYCNYELILMDCNMPIMDGYQATQKIRQYLFDLGINQPIIVAATGHTEEVYVNRAINSGMN